MKMTLWKKLVVLEPIGLSQVAMQELTQRALELVVYDTVPTSEEEILFRMQNADAVLVSYTTTITGAVLQLCPQLRYVGMCCSLYSIESANVDIATATKLNMIVKGVRDYGDEGVAEYVVYELIGFLHGYRQQAFDPIPRELTNLKVGIVGLGTTGQIIAHALQHFGSHISYFSRTRKAECEVEGMEYLPLDDLLAKCEVVCTCLNKNVILLHPKQFSQLGNHKILMNISIGPCFDSSALEQWLSLNDTHFFCDGQRALGQESLATHPRVHCLNTSAGYSTQSIDRLSQKVLANLDQASIEVNESSYSI